MRSFTSKAERITAARNAAALGAGLVFALAGCSGASTTPAPQSGGMGGASAGAAGGMAAAGAGGTPGAGMGGSAGMGTAGAGQVLVVNCNGTTYADALRANCVMPGCHSAAYPASGMNLTPDSGLVARLKDVPAKHQDIFCEDVGDYCVPATCPPAGQALLVDSADYTQSWILKKLAFGVSMCGSDMPGVAFKGPNDLACIQSMVQAIAALPK